MPRRTVEAKAAAIYRQAGATFPAAPAGLSKPASVLWDSIVQARAPDFFRPGSLELLMNFVELAITQRYLLARVAKLRAGPNAQDLREALRDARENAHILNMTALKLRITPQQETDSEDVKAREKEPPLHRLIGGDAFRLDG